MPNPIFSGFNRPARSPQPNQNMDGSLFSLMNQARNSPNPDAFAQNLLATNPKFQGIVSFINQNGGDAKTAFYNLAAQKGVNPEAFLRNLR